MGRKHGRRPHTVQIDKRCPVKVAYTTYEAADAARARTPDAERVHRGECCGYYHVTSMTEAEFAQVVATRGVQDSATRGMLDLSPEEYLREMDRRQSREAQAEAAGWHAAAQPGPGAGGPGEAAVERRASLGPTPSPAEVARRLQAGGRTRR